MGSIHEWLVPAILTLVLWGLWGYMLKFAGMRLDWREVYFISSLASFTLALMFYLYSKGFSLSLNTYALYAALAGLMGGLGYLTFMIAISKGKASIIIPLTALYPAITAILAVLFLGEKLKPTQLVGIVLALIAGILVSL